MSAVNNDEAAPGSRRALALAAAAVAITAISVLAAPGAAGLCGAMLGLIVLAIADIDARVGIIPDELNAAAVVLGLANIAAIPASDDTLMTFGGALAGAFVAAGVFWLVGQLYKRAR